MKDFFNLKNLITILFYMGGFVVFDNLFNSEVSLASSLTVGALAGVVSIVVFNKSKSNNNT